MGRPVLTPDDRLAIAQRRGYIVQSTLDRQNQLKETEQSSLAGATEEKHEDVEKLWQEYVQIVNSQRLFYKYIRFLTVKELDINLQPDSAMFKDFVEYYASSRNGLIDKLATVHSIKTIWYRFVGYRNCITKTKLDRQLVNDVYAVSSQDSA